MKIDLHHQLLTWRKEIAHRGLLPRSGVAALHVKHPVHSTDGELLWYDASELDEVIALLVPTQD